jgi:hypothetical protein
MKMDSTDNEVSIMHLSSEERTGHKKWELNELQSALSLALGRFETNLWPNEINLILGVCVANFVWEDGLIWWSNQRNRSSPEQIEWNRSPAHEGKRNYVLPDGKSSFTLPEHGWCFCCSSLNTINSLKFTPRLSDQRGNSELWWSEFLIDWRRWDCEITM